MSTDDAAAPDESEDEDADVVSADEGSEPVTVDRPQSRGWLLGTAWLVSLIYLCGTTLADPDLWGHTFYGLRCVQSGMLTESADPYSYTARGAPWINHEWLTEYFMGWLWLDHRNIGLIAWRNAWVLILWIVVAMALRRASIGLGAGLFLLVFNAEVLSDFVVFVRPQLATFALFAVFLLVLRSWWDDTSSSEPLAVATSDELTDIKLWSLVPLTAVWTNLHGGFLAGIGVLGVFVVGATWRGRRDPTLQPAARQLQTVSLMACLATLLNPDMHQLHLMLWQHLITEQFVREWQPVWAIGLAPVPCVPFLIVALALGRSRRWQWIDVAVLAVVCLQAVLHLRHVALLSIAVLILLPAATDDALRSLFPQLTERWSRPANRLPRVLAVLAACAFLLGIQARASRDLWREGVRPWEIAVECRGQVPGMPVAALRFMDEHEICGNVLTDYGWGQFIIWHSYSQTKVAFDGRYRTVYPEKIEQQFLEWQRANESRDRTPMIDEHPTNAALLPAGGAPDRWLTRREDWGCVYRDSQAAVFIRRGPHYDQIIGPAAEWKPQPPVPAWDVFPASLGSAQPVH